MRMEKKREGVSLTLGTRCDIIPQQCVLGNRCVCEARRKNARRFRCSVAALGAGTATLPWPTHFINCEALAYNVLM
jgi:hypothetical protein